MNSKTVTGALWKGMGTRHALCKRAHEDTERRQPGWPGQPGREAPVKTNHIDTFILDFYPMELQEMKCLLFELPVLWYFVMAALED